MSKFFESFLQKMKADFRRIAKATRHEMTVGDLQGDSWIVAEEIGKRRGRKIDFSDPEDQNLVIRAVNLKNVRRGDWKMRRAVRIDEEPDDEDGFPKWSNRLAAKASSDPLVSLLLQESEHEAESLLASSFSQAAAYLMMFWYFKNDREKACAHLAISDSTLYKRVGSAAAVVRVQPSLFDRIERITDAFLPLQGRRYLARAEIPVTSVQSAWKFQEA